MKDPKIKLNNGLKLKPYLRVNSENKEAKKEDDFKYKIKYYTRIKDDRITA